MGRNATSSEEQWLGISLLQKGEDVVYHVGIAPEPGKRRKTTSSEHPQSSLKIRTHDIGGARVGSSSANSRTETKGGLRGTESDRERVLGRTMRGWCVVPSAGGALCAPRERPQGFWSKPAHSSGVLCRESLGWILVLRNHARPSARKRHKAMKTEEGGAAVRTPRCPHFPHLFRTPGRIEGAEVLRKLFSC